jgi:hypothetical protein
MSNANRVVIIGGPKTGKTSLSMALLAIGHLEPAQIRHTDELRADNNWSEASAEASKWFDAPGPWIVEGVAAVRALRKWLATNPTGKPCDEVRVLLKPMADTSKGQAAMAKGASTIFGEIRAELVERGVTVTTDWPTDLPAEAVELGRGEAARLDAEMKARATKPTSSAPVAFKVNPGETVTFTEQTATLEAGGPAAKFGELPPADSTLKSGEPLANVRADTPALDPAAGMGPPFASAELKPRDLAPGEMLAEAPEAANIGTPISTPDGFVGEELPATSGDKRAKQWWKNRPWKDGPNGSTPGK